MPGILKPNEGKHQGSETTSPNLNGSQKETTIPTRKKIGGGISHIQSGISAPAGGMGSGYHVPGMIGTTPILKGNTHS